MRETLKNMQKWIAISRNLVEAGLVLMLAFVYSQAFWSAVSIYQLSEDEPDASIVRGYVSAQSVKHVGDFEILANSNPFLSSGRKDAQINAATFSAPKTSLNLKLKGVRAKGDGTGVAFIVLPDNKQIRADIGSEILDNVVLKHVSHDRVNLLTRGQLETLYLRNPEGEQARAKTVVEANQPVPETIEGGEVSAQRFLQSVSFTIVREDGARAGFRLMPKTSATALTSAGFQPGDIIRKVNQRSVSDVNGEDLQELLLASRAINFDIERDGNPKRLLVRFGRG